MGRTGAPSQSALYQLYLQRDPKHDGRFLTGVLSTGIYCLPSCPARRPLPQNLQFFKTQDEAVRFGLRPCLRCHPDWFYRGEAWQEALFERTAAMVRLEPGAFPDVRSLARAAGVGGARLNELFRVHAQESPEAFLRRVRVAHVRSLLACGASPADAASLAGFAGSVAFFRQFAQLTGLTPEAYAELGSSPSFELRLPANYAARAVLAFHGRDPEGVCERVQETTITKCVAGGLLRLRLDNLSARCEFEGLDAHAAHGIAVRMLGLGQDAVGFERQFADDALLGPLVQRQAGLRIPLSATPWEGLAWAIVGQQIGLGFAVSLRRRLIQLAGDRHVSGQCSHPGPVAVARLEVSDLKQLQFSKSKAEYLLEAARTLAAGELDLDNLRNLSARRAARTLSSLRGIGPWTVDYVFLRGLGFPDSLPSGDAGIAQGLERLIGSRPGEKEIRELATRYSPWRSLAAAHIWASLQTGKPEAAKPA